MKKIKPVIQKILKRLKPSSFQIIWMSILFASFCGVFCSGSLSKKTYSESIANDVALLVKDNKNTNIICESREGSKILSKQSFAYSTNEKFNSKYPFKCVMGYNFDKRINCSLTELGNFGKNLSLITSNYFTNDSWLKKETITFDAYKIELLYRGTNTNRESDQDNFVYISKSQADYLISSNTSFNTYDDLINTSLTFNEVGVASVKWKIANIFCDDSVFCNEATKSLDNYVICFSYLSESLKKTESMMFSFYDISYSNIEYLDSIKSEFPADTFEFSSQKVSENNSTKRLVNYLNGFYDIKDGSQTLSIILFVVSIVPFFVFGVLLLKQKTNYVFLIQFLFVSLLSWLTFFIIYKISKSVLFFSSLSLLIFLIITLLMLFLELEYLLMDKYERKN